MEKRFCIYGFLTGSPIVGGLSAIRKLSSWDHGWLEGLFISPSRPTAILNELLNKPLGENRVCADNGGSECNGLLT